MGKTDTIFESVVAEDDQPASPRGDPHVELQNTIDAKHRRTEAFLKLQQKYLDKSNRMEKRLYKLAGDKHPTFRKIMKLASQAMWDPRRFNEIMSESDAIVEAIMEDDDNVIGGAGRFRTGVPATDPRQGEMETVKALRDSRLKQVQADIWSLTTTMNLMRQRRNGEALVQLDDMLESKRKELVEFQSED